MQIKEVEHDDELSQLFEMVLHFKSLSHFKHLPVDLQHTLATVIRFMQSETCAAFIAVKGGKVIGFLLAECYASDFSNHLLATENGWFVEEAHRGTRAGEKLLEHYLQWSNNRGCLETYLAINSGLNMEVPRRLSSKFGFTAIGTIARV